MGTSRVIRHHGLLPSSEAMGSVGAPAPGNGSFVSPSTFTQRHCVSCRTYHRPPSLSYGEWVLSPACWSSTRTWYVDCVADSSGEIKILKDFHVGVVLSAETFVLQGIGKCTATELARWWHQAAVHRGKARDEEDL